MDEALALRPSFAQAASSSSSSSSCRSSSSVTGAGGGGGSKYLMPPNYPKHEPVFYIPPAPSLTKVAEPRPPKRAPVAGYDMKTLRKQLDFLQGEIEEREQTQALLYAQNGELWTYSEALAEAHRRNAALVKDQVARLHTDLQKAHADRLTLARQLQQAQDSKLMMRQLQADLGEALQEQKGAEKLRLEAEAALAGARAENDLHQEMLQRKVDTMQTLHWQLDSSHAAFDEIASLEKAEAHFSESRTVLRGAYAKFKQGVLVRVRLARLGRAISSVRNRQLISCCVRLWQGYLTRRRFMHASDCRRVEALLVRVLDHWKLYRVVERVAAQTQRRRVLRNVFSAWRTEAGQTRWTAWALEAEAGFKVRQTLRRVFNAWEKLSLVREWRHPDMLAKERSAVAHWLGKVLRAWRLEAWASAERLAFAVSSVEELPRRRAMAGWKLLCSSLWRRRGRLCKRFFSNSRTMLQRRFVFSGHRHNAIAMWAWLNKRGYLRRWTTLDKRRRRTARLIGYKGVGRGRGRFVGNRNQRVLSTGLASLALGAAVWRRQRVCLQAAKGHFLHRRGRAAFSCWLEQARYRSTCRAQKRRALLLKVFGAWRIFVPLQRREVRVEAAVERMFERQISRGLNGCFRQWHAAARRQLLLRSRSERLSSKTRQCCQRRAFTLWKGSWASKLFWRSREHAEEQYRVRAIVNNKARESEEMEREIAELRGAAERQGETVASLQTQLDNKEALLRDALISLDARRADKAALETELKQSREELEKAQAERKRLQKVERELLAAAAKEQAVLEERKAQAEKVLQALVAETDALRSEAQAAQEQAEAAERMASEGVLRQEQRLAAAQAEAEELEATLRQKNGQVRTLSLEQQHLESELGGVQQRLDDFLRDDRQAAERDDTEQRQKLSRVRVLRTDAGLAEARVAELRRLVLEQRWQQGAVERERVLNEEQRELLELADIRRQTLSSPNLPPPLEGLHSVPARHTISLSVTPDGPVAEPFATLTGRQGSATLRQPSSKPGRAPSIGSSSAGSTGSATRLTRKKQGQSGQVRGFLINAPGSFSRPRPSVNRAPLRRGPLRAQLPGNKGPPVSHSLRSSKHPRPGDVSDGDDASDEDDEGEDDEGGLGDSDSGLGLDSDTLPGDGDDLEGADLVPARQSAWALKSRLAVQQLTDRLKQRLAF